MVADANFPLPDEIEYHEAEVLLFILQMMFHEKEWARASSTVGMEERWWGAEVKALLLYALCDIEPTERDFPYTSYEVKGIMNFWERCPEILKNLCSDLYDDMIERYAQRQENILRSRATNHSPVTGTKPPVVETLDIDSFDAHRYA